MSAPVISHADMLEIQLRKWMSKRQVYNVKFNPAHSHPSIPEGEKIIAEIIDRRGAGIFFTGAGFALPGHGFISYDDIIAANWIAAQSFKARAIRKQEDFDHIELSMRNGFSITLTDLDQSVFPLLHFFQWLVKSGKIKSEMP